MSSHRANMMRLLAEARGESGKSLCVLGAGNANDIDLAVLAHDFERIALVDLDERSLELATERLSEDARRRVEQHAPVDLTSIVSILGGWEADTAPPEADISAAINAAKAARPPDVGAFDVVASTCVLSQLIDSIYMRLATTHPQCQELVMAVRNRHLEMMVELLNPGGVGLLITDFVATETAPELAHIDDRLVPAAAARWINERNFFTGANPYAIRDCFQNLNGAGRTVENVQVSPAWRWDMGAKQLAVSAVTFRRGG